jgi:hypothetical protein
LNPLHHELNANQLVQIHTRGNYVASSQSRMFAGNTQSPANFFKHFDEKNVICP